MKNWSKILLIIGLIGIGLFTYELAIIGQNALYYAVCLHCAYELVVDNK